ncbi:hypothetical protein B0I35DRAFT_131469 [Stachybotrys elegans]|uniref:Uncharacterized protein n=1 Tax=Stachybotrys elegans TaxID=80388 RepID=A0A8K0WVL3_9HYPO|nr:hypothetical protein B0I35DRAFT_131469 [Stachybotrys elegans]
MASLKEIINPDDDQVDSPNVKKDKDQPGPSSFHAPSPSSTPSSNYPPIPSLASRHSQRRPSPPHPSQSLDTEPHPFTPAHYPPPDAANRDESNKSADSMDSPAVHYGRPVAPSRPSNNGSMVRPFQSSGAGSGSVRLTPVTGKISRAKKGVAVHECDQCHPPKVRSFPVRSGYASCSRQLTRSIGLYQSRASQATQAEPQPPGSALSCLWLYQNLSPKRSPRTPPAKARARRAIPPGEPFIKHPTAIDRQPISSPLAI